MVENETRLTFVEKIRKMSRLLTDIMKESGQKAGNTLFAPIKHPHFQTNSIVIKQGFFFLLVTNGTTAITDAFHRYTLSANQLLVLTPSTESVLSNASPDFSMSALYINPDYFDSLPDGQPVYNQVARYLGNYQLPIFRLQDASAKYMQKTMSLFSEQLKAMQLYQDGIIRHLCSFLLLQITDALCQENRNTPVCVKRSNEIFRNFKKLLVHHYREAHTIQFYADQLHISTTYLSRIVKELTGHTVCFHVSELLCADARKLLECTDMDIKEIADYLGFSDQSVFGKFFIRKTGLSPLKFRMRKERKGKEDKSGVQASQGL